MSSSIYPSYPPQLSKEQTRYLLTNVKDWSIAHGLAVRPSNAFIPETLDPGMALATTAPVTLFPSLFPRQCFQQGVSIQELYNKLYAKIATDVEWLEPIVQELLGIDDFVAELWKVHVKVAGEGYVQDLSLGLFRSDYMAHIDPGRTKSPGIKQVEFNTIASSFGGLSTKVAALHQHLESSRAYPLSWNSNLDQSALQSSESVTLLASGLAAAHKAYGRAKENLDSCVIILVQEPERNVFDQRLVQYALSEQYGVLVFRLPFSRILKDTTLTEDRTLVYHPPHAPELEYEVTTVYFRAGYSPGDYRGEVDWTARLLIERSRAIKCPSVLTQLAGCKKIQQVLATPNSPHLSRFLHEATEASRVLETFAPIYPMDNISQAGKEARTLATNPNTSSRFVLKPQREGGGNNIYRKSIPAFLKSIPEEQWPAYILMEMIEPPAQQNVIFRNGEVHSGGVICELGIYGVCLWKTKGQGSTKKAEFLENFAAGYLLRTKGDQSEEGGVAAGFGAVDSCCLVDL